MGPGLSPENTEGTRMIARVHQRDPDGMIVREPRKDPDDRYKEFALNWLAKLEPGFTFSCN